MYRDLLFYYGVDLVKVIEGDGPPPSLVCELIRGLPDDSMSHALRSGGMQFFGWGADRHLAAATYDAVNVNTTVSGNWRKKPPKFPVYPRPQKAVKKKAKSTVASLFARLSNKLEGGGTRG